MATSSEEQKACMKLIAEWATEKEDSFPSRLKDLLSSLGFPRVLVLASAPLLAPYEARLYSDKIQVQAQTVATTAVLAQFPDAERFPAHVVPMVSYNATTGEAIRTFPAGRFVAIDLKVPGARVVVTAQLTGCSFVIGFDKNNKNRVLLGHAQPKKMQAGAGAGASALPAGQLSNRAELAKHFKEADGKSVFEGEEVKDVYVMGGDSKGYGEDTADVLGWISGGKFFLALMTRSEKKLSIHQYPPSLLNRILKK
ncbi:hypothetical protein GOP47_0012481 [Adiantum capillus-veneris]|uniref:Uncharacterized protein n=1 Tax=Adiantum capillus-veneris TaxID=13818 RepID=A0A9D4UQS3_ADICA|nr:hypothetical protein GOP47_0012481 [Adiantum capillus-veneris]